MIVDSINAVVHVLAAIGLLVLIYLFVKVRSELELLRSFFRRSFQKRVHVDWPLVFVAKFCSALQISFSGNGSQTAGRPMRLEKELIFETLLLYDIDAIQYTVDANRKIHLTLYVVNEVLDRKLLELKLSRALQIEVKVENQKDQRG